MKNKNTTITIIIPETHAGQRLDRALTALLMADGHEVSRARLQALMAEGFVTRAAGEKLPDKRNAAQAVKTGDVYNVVFPPAKSAKPKAQKIALDVVYEDKDLIVINKPAGMVVHPAAGNYDGTLVNALLAHCGKSLSGIGGVARPGIVHRLDKETSGLMVVAKNDRAHHKLAAQFADRSLSRTYQTLVWGVPKPASGKIDAPIGRHKTDRKKMAVVKNGGKPALTFFKTLKVFDDQAALLSCKLATGRTHQIRVHLAHSGYPVVGDPVYGKKQKPRIGGDNVPAILFSGLTRQALHAVELSFIHPTSGKKRSFKSPLPADIAGLLKRLARKR
jgi:23S rRNA pseudouridine1911/1915/1917 synthase